MTGAFDAAQALRAGLGDRRQAWEFIREFAAAWTAPLGPGDGVSADALGSAERHIGAGLSAALREAYLLFGRRPDLTAVQDPLVPPGELGLDDAGNAVVFRAENQRCAAWGVAAADLSSPDPPVYVRHRAGVHQPWQVSQRVRRVPALGRDAGWPGVFGACCPRRWPHLGGSGVAAGRAVLAVGMRARGAANRGPP